MTFQIPIHIPELSAAPANPAIAEEQITITGQPDSVSSDGVCVSKSHIRIMVQKIAQILATQGIPCCECAQSQYKLYPLSDCGDRKLRFSLQIGCPEKDRSCRFELTCIPVIETQNPSKIKEKERK